MKVKINPQKPFFIMLYGYPGCGKSFFASQFAGEFHNTIYLNKNKIASELSKNIPGNDQFIDRMVEYITENYLENGISVVSDAPIIKKSDRKRLSHMALKHKIDPILVWMQIDAESAFLRTKLRAKKNKKEKDIASYSKQQFQEITNNMQNPQNEDFFVISGKHTYKSQRGLVMNKMSKLKIINREQASKSMAKPGLVNLVPNSLSGRGFGRNISIR
jgi:predicted kinase